MATIVDLSHPLEHGQPNFPLDPKISVVEHGNIASLGYNITQISMSTHQGTHLDAPFHFYDDGMTVDKIPLNQFYGPASLIDLVPGSALESKTPITLKMLTPHEEKFQPDAKVIIINDHRKKYHKGGNHRHKNGSFTKNLRRSSLL